MGPLRAPSEGESNLSGERTGEKNQSLRLTDNIGAVVPPHTAFSSLEFLPRTKREKTHLVQKPPSLYNYTLRSHSLRDSSLTQELAARFKITLRILSPKGISGRDCLHPLSSTCGVLGAASVAVQHLSVFFFFSGRCTKKHHTLETIIAPIWKGPALGCDGFQDTGGHCFWGFAQCLAGHRLLKSPESRSSEMTVFVYK